MAADALICCNSPARQGLGIGWKRRFITSSALRCRWRDVDGRFTIPTTYGSKQAIECRPGTWAAVDRTWNAGDRVEIHLPMKLAFAPVDPQHPHRVAAVYGPVVLVRGPETMLVPNVNDISRWIVPKGDGLEFQAASRVTAGFVPFYKVRSRAGYCMYFDLESA
jgi:hypothetical protein